MSRLTHIGESVLAALKPIIEIVHALYLVHFLVGLGLFASLLSWLIPATSALEHALDAIVFSLFILIFAISVYVTQRIRKAPLIIFGSERKSARKYLIELSPSVADTRVGYLILKDYFSDDVIPESVFLNAQKKNSNCVIIAKAENEEIIAFGDYHGLEEAIFNKFVAGEVGEKDIDPVSYLTKTELGRANRFYLGGISVRKDWKVREGEVSQAVIKGMLVAICSAYASQKRSNSARIDIYALGYSQEGRRALEANGFVKVSDRTERRSAPMYTRSTTVRQLRHKKSELTVGNFDVTLKR
jgi:hypothetical protein